MATADSSSKTYREALSTELLCIVDYMSESTSSKFFAYKQLGEKGYFAKAAKGLSLLLDEQGPNPEVSLELAETLLWQGYFNYALEHLDKCLLQDSAAHTGVFPALQMLRAYVFAIFKGQFEDAIKLAKETQEGILFANGLVLNDIRIVVEFYRCSILQLASIVHIVDAANIAHIPDSVLNSAFHLLMEDGRFACAGTVAAISTFNPGSKGALSLLEVLGADTRVPPLIKAKCLVNLAEIHQSDGDVAKCDELYACSRLAFKELDHAYALTEIALTEACRRFQGQISELEEPMMRSIELYEGLDYPRGAIQVLEKVGAIARRLHLYPLQAGISGQVEELAKSSGAFLIWAQAHLKTLSSWAIRSGHGGKVIAGATALYEDLRESECFFMRGQAAQLVTEAYMYLNNAQEAKKWAQKFQQSWKQSSISSQSVAAYAVLRCEILASSGPESLSYILTMAKELAQVDVNNSLPENAIEKLEFVLLHILRLHSQLDAGDRALIPGFFQEIGSLIAKLPDHIAKLKTANLLQATILMREARPRSDTVKEQEALELLEKTAPLYLQESELYRAALTRKMQGLLYHSIFVKAHEATVEDNLHNWNKALGHVTIAAKTFETILQLAELSKCHYWESRLHYEAWELNWMPGATALQKLLNAERDADRIREEISALKGLDAISNKRRLSSDNHVRDVYRIAFHICIHEHSIFDAWEWTQKAKARSLSDILGLGVLIPQSLLEKIQGDGLAKKLHDEERALAEEMNEQPLTEHFAIRVRLEKLHGEMRKVPILAELMDLREGIPLSFSRLQKELSGLKSTLDGRKIVLVDWVFWRDDIWMLLAKSTGEPTTHLLPTSISTVKNWLDQNLNTEKDVKTCIKEDDRDPEHPMHQLSSLILPLASLTDPEDILVLAPTEILHSIPLHALSILHEGNLKPLIERNPVVYTASMTSFIQCCQRAAGAPNPPSLEKNILAAYEPFPGYAFDEREQKEVYSYVEDLALRVDGRSMSGVKLTRSAFAEMAGKSHMLLFHGHCDTDKKDIMKQGLRLPELDGTSSALFSVSDFFQLKLNAPHVSLMACASTSQAIVPGDEPLGLVTALLCAGAASVLGTLWPVQSRSARMFADRFVSNFESARGKYFLNLAVAMREAVLDLRYEVETRAPYHWLRLCCMGLGSVRVFKVFRRFHSPHSSLVGISH